MTIDVERFLRATVSDKDLNHGESGANIRLAESPMIKLISESFYEKQFFNHEKQNADGYLVQRSTGIGIDTKAVVNAYKKAIDRKVKELEQRPDVAAQIKSNERMYAETGISNKPTVKLTEKDLAEIDRDAKEILYNTPPHEIQKTVPAPTVAPVVAPTVAPTVVALTSKEFMKHVDNKLVEPNVKAIDALNNGAQMASARVVQNTPDGALNAGDKVLFAKGKEDKEAFIVINDAGKIKSESGDLDLLNEMKEKMREKAKEAQERGGKGDDDDNKRGR
jgi:hypothetical protein